MLFKHYRVYANGAWVWEADSSSIDTASLRERLDRERKVFGEGHPLGPVEGGVDAYMPSAGGWVHVFTIRITFSGIFGMAQEREVYVHNLPPDQISRGRMPIGVVVDDRSFPRPEVDNRPVVAPMP